MTVTLCHHFVGFWFAKGRQSCSRCTDLSDFRGWFRAWLWGCAFVGLGSQCCPIFVDDVLMWFSKNFCRWWDVFDLVLFVEDNDLCYSLLGVVFAFRRNFQALKKTARYLLPFLCQSNLPPKNPLSFNMFQSIYWIKIESLFHGY